MGQENHQKVAKMAKNVAKPSKAGRSVVTSVHLFYFFCLNKDCENKDRLGAGIRVTLRLLSMNTNMCGKKVIEYFEVR